MLFQDRSYISYTKLNEQCRRAADVIERHAEKSPAIDLQRLVLLPVFSRYLEQQEQLTRSKVGCREALLEGNRAVKELYVHMRSWFGQIGFLLPSFDPHDFDCHVNAPDSASRGRS